MIPGYATAHQSYAELLSELGRHDEALAEIRLAQQLDPFSLIINVVRADSLRTAGQNDLAIEQLRKTLDIDPNFAHAYFHLGLTQLRKGAFLEAVAEFQRAVALSPNVTDYKGGLGYAYARAGKRVEARKLLDELKERSKRVMSRGSISLGFMRGWRKRIKRSLAWKRRMSSESRDLRS